VSEWRWVAWHGTTEYFTFHRGTLLNTRSMESPKAFAYLLLHTGCAHLHCIRTTITVDPTSSKKNRVWGYGLQSWGSGHIQTVMNLPASQEELGSMALGTQVAILGSRYLWLI